MEVEISSAEQILSQYLQKKTAGNNLSVDRPEIVAHALLSGLCHHWPSRANDAQRELIQSTLDIRAAENSRWLTQRRIAIAKLARAFAVC